ncbi:patatin-like phospholipase family protein [Massilia niabensis]|uniref:Patatin-like phospholipase family protein n=1 Tax=Massilia niabensis TaxID=544910 RepID=A0ABW0L369_9BURK
MTRTKRRSAGILAILAFTVAMIGCANSVTATSDELAPHRLHEIRATKRVVSPDSRRPVIALVLGGGGLRGFAHVGAIRALEEAGFKPTIVVGTSAGAVVGAAYASGLGPDQIQLATQDVKISSLMDFTLSSSGLIRGNNLAKWIGSVTQDVPIESFPIRFAAVATDLNSGQPVSIDQGSAGRAIQASSAVPGVNVPVAYGAGYLVDGGVTSLVPVRFARAMGADIVIAVEIYCHGPRTDGISIPAVLGNVMRTQSCLVAAPEMAEADLLIAPTITVPGIAAKEAQAAVVQAGYEAARVALETWRPDAG